MGIVYILVSAGMKFRNKEEFEYGIPAYTGPFRALAATVMFYRLIVLLR
jgi:hypothetical protein